MSNLFMQTNNREGREQQSEESPTSVRDQTKAVKAHNEDNLLNHGCHQFTIDSITVIALNKKNAIKKVNKFKTQTI